MTILKQIGFYATVSVGFGSLLFLGTINHPECSGYKVANADISEVSVEGVVNGIGEHAGKPVAYLKHNGCMYKAEVRGDERTVLEGSYTLKSFGDMYSHIAEPTLVVYSLE